MVNTDPNCGRTTDSDMALGSSPCHDATLVAGDKQASIPTHFLPPSPPQSCLFPQHMNHSVSLPFHVSNTYLFVIKHPSGWCLVAASDRPDHEDPGCPMGACRSISWSSFLNKSSAFDHSRLNISQLKLKIQNKHEHYHEKSLIVKWSILKNIEFKNTSWDKPSMHCRNSVV